MKKGTPNYMNVLAERLRDVGFVVARRAAATIVTVSNTSESREVAEHITTFNEEHGTRFRCGAVHKGALTVYVA